MSGPTEHPLTYALGHGWRWLENPIDQSVVLLHDSGMYTEMAMVTLWPSYRENKLWAPLAKALHKAVAFNMRGRVLCTEYKQPSGTFRVEVEPWPRL